MLVSACRPADEPGIRGPRRVINLGQLCGLAPPGRGRADDHGLVDGLARRLPGPRGPLRSRRMP
ncbi:MAG: hypothetical protein MZV64_64245 [Ignavibacteriales bacterium]|nr:hypothetical protein [Ignavibacteriales bacterium]